MPLGSILMRKDKRRGGDCIPEADMQWIGILEGENWSHGRRKQSNSRSKFHSAEERWEFPSQRGSLHYQDSFGFFGQKPNSQSSKREWTLENLARLWMPLEAPKWKVSHVLINSFSLSLTSPPPCSSGLCSFPGRLSLYGGYRTQRKEHTHVSLPVPGLVYKHYSDWPRSGYVSPKILLLAGEMASLGQEWRVPF